MNEEDQREQLITWLKDAYGMEKSQIKMLDQFIKDFDDEQDIRSTLEQHREQTEQQCDRLATCLEQFDEKPSKIKAATASVMGMGQGFTTSMTMDTKVKDMIMLHAGEHFEHASYLSLGEAARQLGEDEVARVAEEIAEEEKATADWAETQIPKVVDKVLAAA